VPYFIKIIINFVISIRIDLIYLVLKPRFQFLVIIFYRKDILVLCSIRGYYGHIAYSGSDCCTGIKKSSAHKYYKKYQNHDYADHGMLFGKVLHPLTDCTYYIPGFFSYLFTKLGTAFCSLGLFLYHFPLKFFSGSFLCGICTSARKLSFPMYFLAVLTAFYLRSNVTDCTAGNISANIKNFLGNSTLSFAIIRRVHNI